MGSPSRCGLYEVNSAWTWFNWKARRRLVTRPRRCTGRARPGDSFYESESGRARASLTSREVHWLAEWRKQLVRCFVCASTHGLKLFEFEFEWCTVRLRWLAPNPLLPTTYSPTSSRDLTLPLLPPSSLYQPPLLLLFLPLAPLTPPNRSASFCSSLSYPRAPPSLSLSLFPDQILLNLSPFRSFDVCSLFFLFTIALSLPSCSFPSTRSPKSARTTCGWRSFRSLRIWIVQLQSWMIILFI